MVSALYVIWISSTKKNHNGYLQLFFVYFHWHNFESFKLTKSFPVLWIFSRNFRSLQQIPSLHIHSGYFCSWLQNLLNNSGNSVRCNVRNLKIELWIAFFVHVQINCTAWLFFWFQRLLYTEKLWSSIQLVCMFCWVEKKYLFRRETNWKFLKKN